MFTKRLPSFVAAALLVAGCVPVAAQTTGSARPFHGALFGAHGSENSTQKLDVSALVLEAFLDTQASVRSSRRRSQAGLVHLVNGCRGDAEFGGSRTIGSAGASPAGAFR